MTDYLTGWSNGSPLDIPPRSCYYDYGLVPQAQMSPRLASPRLVSIRDRAVTAAVRRGGNGGSGGGGGNDDDSCLSLSIFLLLPLEQPGNQSSNPVTEDGKKRSESGLSLGEAELTK